MKMIWLLLLSINILFANNLMIKEGDVTLLINNHMVKVQKDHNLTLSPGTMVCFIKGNGKVFIDDKKRLDSKKKGCYQIPIGDDFNITSSEDKVIVTSHKESKSGTRSAKGYYENQSANRHIVQPHRSTTSGTLGTNSFGSINKKSLQPHRKISGTRSAKGYYENQSANRHIVQPHRSTTKCGTLGTNSWGKRLQAPRSSTIDSITKKRLHESSRSSTINSITKKRLQAHRPSRSYMESAPASSGYEEERRRKYEEERKMEEKEAHGQVFYEKGNHTIVDILYGTDREIDTKEDWENYYTGERAKLQFGVAQVSIPKKHKFGEMERPNKYLFWQKEKIGEHVVVVKLEDINKKEFSKFLGSKLNNVEEKDILIFIHGFNVTFASAIRRTAQLSYDLKFKGVPMTYSWPSAGETSEYMRDESSVKYTIPHLVAFLKEVIDNKGEANIHIIGHSMGTRALTHAIKEISFVYTDKHVFKNIILAAPDIDQDVFAVSLFPYIQKTTDQITLYASSDDAALKLSNTLHSEKRIGQGGDGIFVFEGLVTVDATGIDTSLLGHSYFAEKEILVKDLKDVIDKSLPPSKRDSLIEKIKERLAYWKFKIER